MLKAIYAVLGSAIVAGSFFAALSISAEVEARGSVPGAKGDRADARPLAGACSSHAWPYFEAACLRDTRNPFGQARDARLVSLDSSTSVKGRDARPVASDRPTPAKARDARLVSIDRPAGTKAAR